LISSFTFTALGFIETPFKERFGTPRQPSLVPASWGILRLRPELNLAEALEGLEGFSHVWLIFVFHENTNKRVKAKIHPPRMGGEKTGLFATRTPHRPNPIGLSAVKLEKIESGILYFSGVDLLHGTPILDIKPYLPSSDCLATATAGWTQSKPTKTIRVAFTDTSLIDITKAVGPSDAARFQDTIQQVLELDPRPNFYKGTKENPNPYTDTYGLRLDNFNIVYQMTDDVATILRLEPWDDYLAKSGQGIV
jgi:tRNA-Thr(GGU) m(6)t(6)A37 methyltransferase TsaA